MATEILDPERVVTLIEKNLKRLSRERQELIEQDKINREEAMLAGMIYGLNKALQIIAEN